MYELSVWLDITNIFLLAEYLDKLRLAKDYNCKFDSKRASERIVLDATSFLDNNNEISMYTTITGSGGQVYW